MHISLSFTNSFYWNENLLTINSTKLILWLHGKYGILFFLNCFFKTYNFNGFGIKYEPHFVFQVKVPTWINGIEGSEYVGVGARFGPTLESKEKRANHTRVVLADPPDCCKTQRKVFLFLTIFFTCLIMIQICFFLIGTHKLYNLLYGSIIWNAWPFASFQARSFWCTEELAVSQTRQILLKLLMLQLFSL